MTVFYNSHYMQPSTTTTRLDLPGWQESYCNAGPHSRCRALCCIQCIRQVMIALANTKTVHRNAYLEIPHLYTIYKRKCSQRQNTAPGMSCVRSDTQTKQCPTRPHPVTQRQSILSSLIVSFDTAGPTVLQDAVICTAQSRAHFNATSHTALQYYFPRFLLF